MQGRPGAQQQYKKCAKLSAVIRSKLFLHEHENNTHEAERALPAWRGAGGSSRGTRPLLYSSDGARSCRLLFAVSAAVRTWCGGETSTSKRVRVLVTRCSSKNSKRNHQPKKRSLPSSSTKQSAQQRVRGQHTQGTTSPLKPLLSSSDGARSCRLRLRCQQRYALGAAAKRVRVNEYEY